MQDGLIIVHNIPPMSPPELRQAILVTAAAASIYGAYMLFVGPTIINRTPDPEHDTSGIYDILLNMLEVHVNHMITIVSQIYGLPSDYLQTIPISEVVNIIGYLTPIIKHHELIFYLLISMVNCLEYFDSSLLESYNDIFVQMREQGNYLIEVYRMLEARAGIDIAHSAISLQDYET